MKRVSFYFAALVTLAVGASIPAATLYVDLNSTNPVSPYAGWSTAATNIQNAIDASTNGDQVWVTNGIYATGGKSMDGVITNRVSVDKAITVQSVNGPYLTIIQGAWDPVSTNGPLAVRCTWLTNGAMLSGFTLANGATGTGSFEGGSADSGGGVFCGSTNAVVANCILTNNSAIFGAGGSSGTLNNCLLIGNTAFQLGGGAVLSTLNNCTAVSNYCNYYWSGANGTGSGAGAYDCVARNSILINNFSFHPYPFPPTGQLWLFLFST